MTLSFSLAALAALELAHPNCSTSPPRLSHLRLSAADGVE